MRLLNATTYEFHTVLGRKKPRYAILSHTWEDDEVLFEDIRNTSRADWNAKKGFFKIMKTCEQALKDGCDYVWIDTCNINKDSSTELSEAINSMFRWYEDATICYAYISDIKAEDGHALSECRWFTRGWTLQEMIVPDRVHFYDRDWRFLGSRMTLARQLQAASGIQKSVLLRRSLHVGDRVGDDHEAQIAITTEEDCQCCPVAHLDNARSMLNRFSVAQKMKWASMRTTTREEDIAYCLMGLFDVNMPLLYGEGPKAFFRLQKAILGMRSDHSILAFQLSSVGFGSSPLLAPTLTVFRNEVQNMHMPAHSTFTSLSGTTLSIEMLICPVKVNIESQEYLGILDCSMNGDPHMRPAILLLAVDEGRRIFRRISRATNLFCLHSSHSGEARVLADAEPELSLPCLRYKPSEVKRVRIAIISEDIVIPTGGYTAAYVKVNIPAVLSGSECQFTSSPPLIAGNLLDTTCHFGSIDFSFKRGGGFSVYWQESYGQLQYSIKSYLQLGDKKMMKKGINPNLDLEWLRDTCMTKPLTKLDESESIILKWPGTAHLEVWISISREIFLGSCHFVLSVHGKTWDLESDEKKKAGLIPRLLGRISRSEDLSLQEDS